MTPIRMRLFSAAFLAVATAIAFNALYLQNAPRPAGSAAAPSAAPLDKASSHSTASLPEKEPAPAEAAPSESAPEPDAAPHAEPPVSETPKASAPAQAQPAAPSPTLVKAIRRELADRGYAPGDAPGELDVATRAAIIAYEFDENMPLTGEASETVLKSLIFGRASGKSGPGPAGRFERRRELVAEVQDALARLGYAFGPIDGRLDAETREAIRKFEADRRLDAQGRLTERVLLEMVIVTGRPLNASG
jgi:peptidoglycan hydrolase-like protein with peptidoglycan-binding domain